MGDILREYASSSNPSKKYAVIQGGDGVIYCNCPGWKMRKSCKHLVDYLGSTGSTTAIAPAPPMPKPASVSASVPAAFSQSAKGIFHTDAFQTAKWYQGCGGLVEGDITEMMANLTKLEKGGKYIAEPKLDGIWIANFADGNINRFWSRNQKEKAYGLRDHKLPPGTLLIGELGFGSEHSIERRAKLGHDWMDVFGILFDNYEPLAHLEENARRERLEAFYDGLSKKDKEYFRLVPQYTVDLDKEFEAQHEGLVLKLAKGPETVYVGGKQKVAHWMKAKKWMEADMVIMDMTLSMAATKIGTPMAEAIVCGQYVKGTLKPLVRVGSMPSNWSKEFAANFAAYKGKVAVVAHFGQFHSGSLRHPSFVSLRDDKDPRECTFVVKDSHDENQDE